MILILPNSVHGIRHLEQWAISNELEGKGRRCVEMTPSTAGIPRSSANWTWASWLSLGARESVRIPRSNRSPPQLATWNHKSFKSITGWGKWEATVGTPHGFRIATHPTTGINCSSNCAISHFRDQILHQIYICTHSFREHSTTTREKELLPFFLQPILTRLLLVDPIVGDVPKKSRSTCVVTTQSTL